MLTLFACPKPFTDPHIAIIQRNAITSWTLLEPRPEIILFGNEAGSSDIAEQLGLLHIREVARNEFGTPLVGDIFEKAVQVASSEFLCYINADIILTNDFMSAFERVVSCENEWLMVGSRTDIDITEFLNFNDKVWEKKLRTLVEKKGVPMVWSSDYFVFHKDFFEIQKMPPFAIGRMAFDNWFFWYASRKHASIVDTSKMVLAAHQNHHFFQNRQDVKFDLEKKRNRELAGDWACSFILADATHELFSLEMKRKLLYSYINRTKVSWKLFDKKLRSALRPYYKMWKDKFVAS